MEVSFNGGWATGFAIGSEGIAAFPHLDYRTCI